MSLITKPITIPGSGLKYEAFSELLEEQFSPNAKNVHEKNGEIHTRPGTSGFGPNDDSLAYYLGYDAGDDSSIGLRIGTNDNINLAQSFLTAAVSRTIDKLKLKFEKNGTPSGKIWVTIETDSSGPSGTVVATSDEVVLDGIVGLPGWLDFTFSSPVTLDASTTYWIVLHGDYAVSSTDYIDWKLDPGGSPYTDGEAYVYDSSWSLIGSAQTLLFKLYRDETLLMLLDTFYLTSGVTYTLAVTLDRVFYYNRTSGTWVTITGYLSTELFTGTSSDRFSSTTYAPGDIWVLTNYVDPVKKWIGGGDLADLGGSPPRAHYVKLYKDHLFLGDVFDGGARVPYRLWWSDTGDIENFSSGAYGYHDFADKEDWINGLFILNDYLVVTKERSIHLGYGVTSEERFQFDIKINGTGPINGDLVLEKDSYLILVAWDDIYAFDGNELVSLAFGLFRQEFYDKLDPQYYYNFFSLDIEETGEWLVFVVEAGHVHPNVAWVLNYKKKSAWRYDFDTELCSAGYSVQVSGTTIGDLVGTIGQQTWRIGDRTILGFNDLNLIGTTDGRVLQLDYLIGEDDGVGVPAFLDTKDFYFLDDKGKPIRGKINGFEFKASGTKAYWYYSTDGGISYHLIKPTGFDLTTGHIVHKYSFRVNTHVIRFRIAKEALGEQFQLKALWFDVQAGGRV